VIAEPPVREDGLCAHCGGPRKFPKRHQKGVDPALYERDPFCATSCARAWHGVPLTNVLGGDPSERRGRYERVAA